ncbi:hypothetical protein EVAR_56982_1 [Eumeta japonica]|uniref:Uncharacterized protein n=1 Tax=Eumeta variegata TaxID=151549 RepID=A0A4C1ZCE9_EUMVA|nr:hypothetical protein EVAR_56982_1 [Eumeta japonica]
MAKGGPSVPGPGDMKARNQRDERATPPHRHAIGDRLSTLTASLAVDRVANQQYIFILTTIVLGVDGRRECRPGNRVDYLAAPLLHAQLEDVPSRNRSLSFMDLFIFLICADVYSLSL